MYNNARKFKILLNILQSSAVTLKPSGIWGCGATYDFLTGKGIGDYGDSRVLLSSFSLFLLTFPKSHIPMDGASSQVKGNSPTFQVRSSKALVSHGSRTDKAVPAPPNSSWFGKGFGVALGLPRKLIWGRQAKGWWPLCFCHDVERAIKSRLNGGFLYPKCYFWA